LAPVVAVYPEGIVAGLLEGQFPTASMGVTIDETMVALKGLPYMCFGTESSMHGP
jgi:hypothetical protein